MNAAADAPILIAGGGIGGVAAALALARRGIPVTVFEQADELREIGAGIQLGPNAFHTFKALGVLEAMLAQAALPTHLEAHDAITGEQLTAIPVADEFERRFGYRYGLIHRADLHRVLLDACRQLPEVTLRAGQKVADFADDGEQVTLTLASGEQHTGRALIGCDGLWSTIRERIVGDGKPRVAGHIAYRAVLPADDVPPANRRNAMTLWMGPKTHLVHYPLRRGEVFNLVAVFHSDRYEEGWDTFGDPEELQQKFAGQCRGVLDMLEKIESWRMWVLCDREPIANWSSGRVTLLGDAAHPMLQYLAQGACMAMEDAVCLAARVAAQPQDLAEAFRHYQQSRYLRTTRVQLTARLYGQVYHAAGATRDLRNAFVRSRTPQQAADSMAWMYDPADIPQ